MSYFTRINGGTVFVINMDGLWRVHEAEQCDDCGRDTYTVLLDASGVPLALECQHCGEHYKLREDV